MKRVYSIIAVILSIFFSFGASVQAKDLIEKQGGKSTIVRTLTFKPEEKILVQDNIIINKLKYKKTDSTQKIQYRNDIKSVTVHKQITISKDDKSLIDSTMKYDQDGYTGTLNATNIAIKINSYKNENKQNIISQNKDYFLPKNDINLISKTIDSSDGVLNLITVNFVPDKTYDVKTNEGTKKIVTQYKALCYYAKINNYTVNVPNDYVADVDYSGQVSKKVEDSVIVETRYSEIPTLKKKTPNVVPPVAAVVCFLFIISVCKNTKIYNLTAAEKYKLITKKHLKITKDNNITIKIDREARRALSNRFEIVFSKRLTKKLVYKHTQILVCYNGKILDYTSNTKDHLRLEITVDI